MHHKQSKIGAVPIRATNFNNVDELTQSTDRQIEVLEYLLDHYKGDYK
jgi:hypothetical protein